MCLIIVIIGTSGSISSPAIPTPSAGNITNQTPTIVSKAANNMVYTIIGCLVIFLATGNTTYPKNNDKPTPFAR